MRIGEGKPEVFIYLRNTSASRILFILSSSCECGDSTRRARQSIHHETRLFESGQHSRVGIRFAGVAASDDNELPADAAQVEKLVLRQFDLGFEVIGGAPLPVTVVGLISFQL